MLNASRKGTNLTYYHGDNFFDLLLCTTLFSSPCSPAMYYVNSYQLVVRIRVGIAYSISLRLYTSTVGSFVMKFSSYQCHYHRPRHRGGCRWQTSLLTPLKRIVIDSLNSSTSRAHCSAVEARINAIYG